MKAVGIDRREAGFACEDGGGGRVEVVGDPTADPVPEGAHPLGGAVVGDQEVSPVGEDGEEKAHGYPVSQERAGPSTWGGEASNKGERGVGQSQAMVEVVRGVEGRRQPVAQPSHHVRWVEDLASITEVQGISFVGSTSEVCHPQPLCNLQNLCPVPP